jgi:hypothetical protein
MMVNLSSNNSYHDNTVFNSAGTALCLNTYPNTLGPGGTAYTALFNNVKRNILFPRAATQLCATYANTLTPSDLNTNLGSLDSNFYCQPYTGGSIVQVQGSSTTNYTLPSFKIAYPAYESHGHVASHLLNAGDNPNTYLRLEVNPTGSVAPVNLGSSTYMDALGNSYTGLVNIPAYGSLALIGTSITLPVSLLEFKAAAYNNSVLLTWKTEYEQNNNYFNVERSLNGIDFNLIGRVNGNGTTTFSGSYNFTDMSPSEGFNYYRLKQTDINGKITYSPVRSVRFYKKSLFVFTKTVDNNLSFAINSDHEIGFIISNSTGQNCFTGKAKGSLLIDISRLSAGVYYISTESGDIERFIKQ